MTQALMILALVVALIFGISFYNETADQRAIATAQADAIRIEAKSEARVNAILAFLPWGILLGASIPLTILALKWQPKRVIEQRMILQIQPGIQAELPRRELWQALASKQVELLPEARRADDTRQILIIK